MKDNAFHKQGGFFHMREREKEESHTVLTEVLNYHPQKPTGTN